MTLHTVETGAGATLVCEDTATQLPAPGQNIDPTSSQGTGIQDPREAEMEVLARSAVPRRTMGDLGRIFE